ncbi:DegV family protein [Halanaerobacter jeridensis]|uniref:DegV family protein with EDD domain n=1 Tax=Halanaerobacter jeridensis TaxID=706427 RepID=A0A938XXX8_9FIRM|nr:DegV family protein [Halanaerobacter jeridensis]MBM7557325.1 DegV family protein with EDD domain [Halanaerobacter jeridensis]
MNSIKIVTDSGADLSTELIKHYNIELIPIPVEINNQQYKDSVDITPDEFYQKLDDVSDKPTTSRITPHQFNDIFSDLLEKYEEVIYISFSSQLSGIYESAVMAQKKIDSDNLTIIDSKAASLGQGLIAIKAAKLAQEGKRKKEIINSINNLITTIEHIFAVGSLKMLKQGGRISSTKAFIGKLLSITPIAEITPKGKIVSLSKVRGKRKFIRFMIKKMKERGNDLSEQVIGISHAQNQELAQTLEQKIKDEFQVEDIIITKIGAAIGSHAGPGTVALFFYN